MKVFSVLCCAYIILLNVTFAFAEEAPVVDILEQTAEQSLSALPPLDETNEGSKKPSENIVSLMDTSDSPGEGLVSQPATVDQRLARLEQQLKNLINMNLPQQMIDLQQELAQLRGQLQVQKHSLQLQSNQQRILYKDLDQRIAQLQKPTKAPNPVDSSKFSENSDLDKGNVSLKDSTVYQEALNILSRKQYDKAEQLFRNYLNNYPTGNYIADAHYWLGEIYLQKRNVSKAATEFQTLQNKFPKSERILDAKLKLAIIDAEMGRVSQAKRELMEIKKQHPESAVAQLANIRLQQLESTATSTTP